MKNITNLCIELQEGKVSKKDFLREARIAFPNYITNINTFQDTINILKRKNLISESCNCENQVQENIDEFSDIEPAMPDEQDLEILDNLDLFDDSINEITIKHNSNLGFKLVDQHDDDFIAIKLTLNNNDTDWVGNYTKGDKWVVIEGSFCDPEETYDRNQMQCLTSLVEYCKLNRIPYLEHNDNDTFFFVNIDVSYVKGLSLFFDNNLNESKKQPKRKLTALEVDPHELRMGMRVEKEHIEDLDKRMKIALDHLSEDPFYYTKLHLAGLDDSKIEKTDKKRTDLPTEVDKKMSNMVDKANQMTSPKGIEKDKASANKAHKETNKIVNGVKEFTHKSTRAKGIKGVMDMTGGKLKKVKSLSEMTMIKSNNLNLKSIIQNMINASFKSESHDIRLEDKGEKVMLKYGYWEDLPLNIVNKLESKFKIDKDDSDHKVFYMISPKVTSEMMNEIKDRIKKLLKNK